MVPETFARQVSEVIRFFLLRGWGIGSGGARGADTYALSAVVAAGSEACSRSVVFLPAGMPAKDSVLRPFVERSGRVVTGVGGGRIALLARSRQLAREAAGVVAFLHGPSRASVFTAGEAIRAGKTAVVLTGGGAVPPCSPLAAGCPADWGCTVREAAGLAELFLAFEASPAVVAHYEVEAKRVGVAGIIEDSSTWSRVLRWLSRCPAPSPRVWAVAGCRSRMQ